jgi:hypothetical protein
MPSPMISPIPAAPATPAQKAIAQMPATCAISPNASPAAP